MAVGPWGEVLAGAGGRPAALVVELDPALLREVRRRIPALRHRVMG
jgi:predicted amidohydrolase